MKKEKEKIKERKQRIEVRCNEATSKIRNGIRTELIALDTCYPDYVFWFNGKYVGYAPRSQADGNLVL